MCPICLKKINIQNTNEISDAHIIPKAAGGNKKTFLCRKCNSKFGSKQDKWFGELIRLVESKENIVQSQIKDNHFYLCGRKVGGEIEYSPEGGFEICIQGDRNSPETNNFVLNQFQREKNKTFSFSVPIMKQKRMIDVGFLTAAYLLWFDIFGYSWVLQSHLDQIREQILKPNKETIKNLYLFKQKTVDDKCWICAVQFSGFIVPAAVFFGYLILMPPFYCQNLYFKLDELLTTSVDKEITWQAGFWPLYFNNRHFYDSPVCLMLNDKFMFAPDAVAAEKIEAITICFSSSNPEATFFHSLPDNKYDELSKNSGIDLRRVKMRGKIERKYFDI